MSTMTSIDPLTEALFTKAQSALLGLFFAHPDESFYLRQILERTDLGTGHAQRELARLTAAGIVRRSIVGRHVFFQAEPDCPVYPELRALIAKTVGAVSVLRQCLAPLADRIAVAFIFGSVAAGRERKASDLDLMIVGSVRLQEVVDALKPAETQLAREINPILYPPAEFRDKLAAQHHFLTSVLRANKLFVLGDADELAHLSQERLDPPARHLPAGNRQAAGHRRSRHSAKPSHKR